MTHSSITIEDYVFNIISQMDLGIRGKFYHKGERPNSSTKEDCTIGFLTATAEQIQQGSVVVNIFVPTLYGSDGVKYIDRDRCSQFEQTLSALPSQLNRQGDVRFSLGGAVTTAMEEVTKQVFVSAKLNFKVLTD